MLTLSTFSQNLKTLDKKLWDFFSWLFLKIISILQGILGRTVWIELDFWDFGSWKTVYLTRVLRNRSMINGEITASTYWTDYTDLHVRSRDDLSRLWWDVYLFHHYIRYYDWMSEKEKKLLPLYYFEEREQFWKYLAFLDPSFSLDTIPMFNRITLALDEGSIYFNNEDFKLVFKGVNKVLLTLLYQPRKIRMHMLVGIQSPSEIHVKFRRLANAWKYFDVAFFKLYRRMYTLYTMNPENFDFEACKVTNINRSIDWFRMFWKNKKYKEIFGLKYNTEEVVDMRFHRYNRWDLFRLLYWKLDYTNHTYIDLEENFEEWGYFPKSSLELSQKIEKEEDGL